MKAVVVLFLVFAFVYALLGSSYLFANEAKDEQVTKIIVGNVPEIQLPDFKVKLDIDKLKQPNSIGATEILSGLALLVSLGTLLYQAFQFNQQKKLSIKETFWMREVLIPRFLKRFLDFIEEAPDFYQTSDGMTDFYQSYAIHEMNKLKDASELLNVGKNGLGNKVSELLIDFDDDVGQVDSTSELTALLNDLAAKVVREIRTAQEKIS